MSASSAPSSSQQQPRAPTRSFAPGEAAIQHGADQIITLFEQQIRTAVAQKDAIIDRLNSDILVYRKALENGGNNTQLLTAGSNAASPTPSTSTPAPAPVDHALQAQQIDELRKECENLRAEATTLKGAAEQMGIHNMGPGLFSFAPQWVELFNQLGIEAGKPWGPEQLLAVIHATAERLRAHRRDVPTAGSVSQLPQYSDPFVLQSEINRARAYLASLEELQSTPQRVPSP